MLVISRIGIAFAHAVFWSITSALAIHGPRQSTGAGAGLTSTGTALAMVFGIPIGRIIGQYFGWRMTFPGDRPRRVNHPSLPRKTAPTCRANILAR